MPGDWSCWGNRSNQLGSMFSKVVESKKRKNVKQFVLVSDVGQRPIALPGHGRVQMTPAPQSHLPRSQKSGILTMCLGCVTVEVTLLTTPGWPAATWTRPPTSPPARKPSWPYLMLSTTRSSVLRRVEEQLMPTAMLTQMPSTLKPQRSVGALKIWCFNDLMTLGAIAI